MYFRAVEGIRKMNLRLEISFQMQTRTVIAELLINRELVIKKPDKFDYNILL